MSSTPLPPPPVPLPGEPEDGTPQEATAEEIQESVDATARLNGPESEDVFAHLRPDGEGRHHHDPDAPGGRDGDAHGSDWHASDTHDGGHA